MNPAEHGINFVELGIGTAKGILLLFSVLSLAVIIERAISLSRIRKVEEAEYQAIRTMLNRKLRGEALARLTNSPAPGPAALQASLDLEDADAETMREAIAQGIEVQSAGLRRNLPLLATVASTAPYVGLFGTVLGILLAFNHIAETNQTGASVVAQPIAESLTATALGLGVAIPAVMAYNYFSGRVNDLSLRVQTHALDIAARLSALPVAAASAAHHSANGQAVVAPMMEKEAVRAS